MRLLVTLLVALLLSTTAMADLTGIEVTLAGGEVVGRTRGRGTASVTARVSNKTGRTLEGIRLAAWYSPADVLPATDADWRIHEFVFDPPLAPGASSTLRFSDESAAQYIMLDARAAKFRAALRYDGVTTDLQFALIKRGDLAYISLRDLVDVVGGRISSEDGVVVIQRGDKTIRLRALTTQVQVNGIARPLSNALIETNGRSYVALRDAASLLDLEASDLGDDLYEFK